jgi:hypothetical protein
MTYYSPGKGYHCPRCKLRLIGFIFDNKYREWFDIMRLINSRQVKLSNLYKDYKKNPDTVKWMCYGCRDCGVVMKK